MQIVTMPKASNSMEEGTVVRWVKKEGETVGQGEILLEIETDKATVEVESPASGTLRAILVGEGAMVPIHAPLAILAEPAESIDAALTEARAQLGGAAAASAPVAAPASAAPQAAPAASAASATSSHVASASTTAVSAFRVPSSEFAPTAPASPAALTDSGRVKASPAARKLASERGVDLAAVGAGSGPGGRVLSTDVPVADAIPAAGMAFPSRPFYPSDPSRPSAGGPGRPLTGMRRAIARNLSLSKQTIPHWYLTVTVDAGPMLALQKSGPGKAPFSINDILVAGIARVMMELPAFRGRLEGDRIVDYPAANVGIAVGTEDALVVPVVLAANELSLRQLGATTRRLVASAREGKVQNAGQGHVTISNLGKFGIDDFVAIINPPETAIVAVGGIREDVIVKNGAIRPGRVMTLTLSSDHRVIDGTMGAKFMARLRQVLEEPEQLLGADKQNESL